MSKHAIPVCLAAFDFIEAAVCLVARDYARAWYWAAYARDHLHAHLKKGPTNGIS